MQKTLVVLVVVATFGSLTACSHWRHWRQQRSQAVAVVKAPAPINPRLLKMGYFPVLKRGEFQYCVNEIPTASRLYSTVCHSEAEILRQESDTIAFIDELNERRGRPSMPAPVRR